MKIVQKQEPIILSSNIPRYEPKIEIYNSKVQKTYPKGELIQDETSIYKVLTDTSSDLAPKDNVLNYEFIRKSSYFAIFDHKQNTSTKNLTRIKYTLKTSDIDSIAFFGLNAQKITLKLYNADDKLIYEKAKNAQVRYVSDWWEWTYERLHQKTNIVFLDLPLIFNAKLEFEIEDLEVTCSCSYVVFGHSKDLGLTLVEPAPSISIRNVIANTNNTEGITSSFVFKTYEKVTCSILLDTNRLQELRDFLKMLGSKPALFVADKTDEGFESLIIYGFHKDFDVPIGLQKSVYNLEIQSIKI